MYHLKGSVTLNGVFNYHFSYNKKVFNIRQNSKALKRGNFNYGDER